MKNDKPETPTPIDDSAELLAALTKISARAVLRNSGPRPHAVDVYAEDVLAFLADARRKGLPIESAIIAKINSARQ